VWEAERGLSTLFEVSRADESVTEGEAMSLYHLLRFGTYAHDLHRGRDTQGRLTEACSVCGFARAVLCEDVVKDGPAHYQAETLGKPITKVTRERPKNVTPFQRQSER